MTQTLTYTDPVLVEAHLCSACSKTASVAVALFSTERFSNTDN